MKEKFCLTDRLNPSGYYDLGLMTMKEYSTFTKAIGLEPQHQIVWWGISAEMQTAYSTAPTD